MADSALQKQSQHLYAALHAAGVRANLILYPNCSQGSTRVCDVGPDNTVKARAIKDMLTFLATTFSSALRRSARAYRLRMHHLCRREGAAILLDSK